MRNIAIGSIAGKPPKHFRHIHTYFNTGVILDTSIRSFIEPADTRLDLCLKRAGEKHRATVKKYLESFSKEAINVAFYFTPFGVLKVKPISRREFVRLREYNAFITANYGQKEQQYRGGLQG